jgi:putative hydrolase of the HAD superfamily
MKLKSSFDPAIKNIVFDLGGVIVDIDIARTLDAFARLDIRGLQPENIHPRQTGFFLEYELGNLTNEAFTAAIRDRYDCTGVTDETIRAAWNALLLDPDPAQFALLDGLRPHYRVFLLSNTNPWHIERLSERYRALTGGDFESHFDACFYSHRLHLRKPDRRIYEAVIAAAGIEPSKTLFIDDNAGNFTGAVETGLQVYHLTLLEKIFALFEPYRRE